MRSLLDADEGDDLAAAIEQLNDERAALELLAQAESELAVDNVENAARLLEQLSLYDEARLDGTAENAVLTGRNAALYTTLRDRIAQAQTE